jgi:hypothetical protein
MSKLNKILPNEIIDKIILYTDLETALKIKNEYCIKKLYNRECHTINISASNGHLETIKWLIKKNHSYSNKSITNAAENGHLEVVEFLFNLVKLKLVSGLYKYLVTQETFHIYIYGL